MLRHHNKSYHHNQTAYAFFSLKPKSPEFDRFWSAISTMRLPTFELSQQAETALFFVFYTLCMLLRNTLVQYFISTPGWHLRKWSLFCLDFCALVVPPFLAQTFWVDYLHVLLLVQLACCLYSSASGRLFVCAMVPRYRHDRRCERCARCALTRGALQRDAHIMFRTLLLIATSLTILAVDFTLFPRRMAKTQYYGQSLMDTGTAAFIFVNALADHDVAARGQSPRQRAAKATMQIFALRMPTLLALFLIGVGRSVFIQLSGYGQDVTEYGVHWNFFLTLFCVRLFVICVPNSMLVFVGVLLGVVYQIALRFTWLEQWLLRPDFTEPRHGFLDQNREGIFSLCGYCFIYAVSLMYARGSNKLMPRDKKLSALNVACGLGFSLCCYGLQRVLEDYFGLIASRRLANMSYSFAMLALFSTICALLQFGQLIVPLPQDARWGGLVAAVSRNALLHFLCANLLTGFVNILAMASPNFEIHGHPMAETVTMLAYALATSLLIYAIHLAKKRSQ
uniref:Phosphatidylinositol-glycan biosynthesis class W protein n=1 Tax=Globodera pallida TaxID=36090 RepID=A0A183C2V6_GLOPA